MGVCRSWRGKIPPTAFGERDTKREAPPLQGEPPVLLFTESLRGDRLPDREGQAVFAAVDDYGIVGPELAADDAAGERVLDVAPDGPRQRSSAELGIVALLGEELLRGVGNLDVDALALEVLVQA